MPFKSVIISTALKRSDFVAKNAADKNKEDESIGRFIFDIIIITAIIIGVYYLLFKMKLYQDRLCSLHLKIKIKLLH